MLFSLLLSCTEYNLGEKVGPRRGGQRNPADDTDVDTAIDTASDTAADADTDTDTDIDTDTDTDTDEPPDEEAYCTPFDDFSGWSYTGEGDWYVEDGKLTEGRNGLYNGIAYLHDLGRADRFLIQVDTAWGPTGNDLTGIAWGLTDGTAFVARWDDPQNYYGRYVPIGGMDVSICDGNGCTPIAADSTADLYWPEDLSFVTWSVEVDGAKVAVVVDGRVVLSATLPEVVGTGPGVVGLYSNDNDGGVWFDNFCVWVGA